MSGANHPQPFVIDRPPLLWYGNGQLSPEILARDGVVVAADFIRSSSDGVESPGEESSGVIFISGFPRRVKAMTEMTKATTPTPCIDASQSEPKSDLGSTKKDMAVPLRAVSPAPV